MAHVKINQLYAFFLPRSDLSIDLLCYNLVVATFTPGYLVKCYLSHHVKHPVGPTWGPLDQFNLVITDHPPCMSWIQWAFHRFKWTGPMDWNKEIWCILKLLNLRVTHQGARMMRLAWNFIYGLISFGSFNLPPRPWLAGMPNRYLIPSFGMILMLIKYT